MLTNFYAPNRYAAPALLALISHMAVCPENLTWVVDFNMPLSLTLDHQATSPYQRLGDQAIFQDGISQLDLLDTWRSFHIRIREFSFYSIPYQMSSRLDYIFISASLGDQLRSSAMGAYFFSDHALVSATLSPFPLARHPLDGEFLQVFYYTQSTSGS